MNTRRLTKKEMWIFAVGQLGWSILGGIINAWLVTFYLPTSDSATKYIKPGLVIFGVLTILGLITLFAVFLMLLLIHLLQHFRIDQKIRKEEEFLLCV